MKQRLVIATLAATWLAILSNCRDPGPDLTYTEPPEGKLRVGSIHVLDGFDSKSPLRFTSDDKQFVIDTFILVVSAIELHACLPGEHPDAQSEPPAERINFRLFDLVGGTAHAHTPGSSTRFGTPVARNLAKQGGRARIVGGIAPPLGIYCHVTAISAPADDDLDNPTSVSTEQLQGNTLMVRGKWRPAPTNESNPQTEWTSFEVTSNRALVTQTPAVDPKTGRAPIRFSEPSDVTMALVETKLTPGHLEPLTGEFPSPEPGAGDALLEQLTRSMRIHEF